MKILLLATTIYSSKEKSSLYSFTYFSKSRYSDKWILLRIFDSVIKCYAGTQHKVNQL